MYIWDYQLAGNWKPKNPHEWEWFLVRKINYGDLRGLNREIIEKYFPRIKDRLDRGKRLLFEYFLNNYRKQR